MGRDFMNIKIDLSVQMTPDKNKLSPSYLCYSKDEVSQVPLIFHCMTMSRLSIKTERYHGKWLESTTLAETLSVKQL